MEAGCEDETASRQQMATGGGGGASSEGGCFDCNICLDVAQDPVVTLCGHLYCWPCLYRWLRGHATCQECPVCKSLVVEDKVVPLYGRGNMGSIDPRKKKILTDNGAGEREDGSIPHRPAALRPELARPSLQAHPSAYTFAAGPLPTMATARFGNVAFSAGFGLFPSLFNFQMHSMGVGLGYPFGVPMSAHSVAPPLAISEDQQQAKLSRLLMCLGFLLLFYIVFF